MNAIEAGSLTEQARRRGRSSNTPLKQAHCRPGEEVNFDDAIEAGSLTEQARRRGRSSNTPLKQAHCRPGEEVNFDDAIEAGSLLTGSLKRLTLNDDAGYLDSTAS